MSWWLIVLICFAGYALLCFVLVPVMVYDQMNHHSHFTCKVKDRICWINRTIISEGTEQEKTLTQRRCSALYVSKHSAVLPFMALSILPRIFAFSIVNRLENKDMKIRELEQQKKCAEAEKKASEEKQRNLLAEFDIVMTKVEEEARKGLTA